MEKMMPVVNFGTEDKPVLAAFRDLVSLTNFVDFYFKNTSLEYVKLPVTLEKIESGSFLFTDRLKMIELPPDIKEIEPGSFLVGRGLRAEKEFNIYAFPDSVGYRYAVENQIPVQPLYAIVTDS